jgi:hypothetical protein
MPEANDLDHGEDQPDYESLGPLIKAYIDQQVQNAAKQYEESQPRKKRWRNSWRSASPMTKAGLYLSAIAVAATIALAIFAWRQLDAMKTIASSNTQQTQQLLDAANQMKVAAWTFSGASIGTNNAVWGAVGKLNIQAGKTTTLADEAIRNNRLQKIIGRAAYGAFIPPFDWMGMYRQGEVIHALIKVSNYGRTPANSVQVAGKMMIRESGPSNSEFNFKEDAFLPSTPNQLLPETPGHPSILSECRIMMKDHVTPKSYAIYASKTIYTWGVVKYFDFTGESISFPFCRKTLASNVFNSVEGEGGGYVSNQSENCEPQNR